MDFQNVKELTITEGDVKTIHDSNGNLLWGALAYEVKYQGDTKQPTYTGTNLWDVDNPYKNNRVIVANGNEVVVTGGAIWEKQNIAQSTTYTASFKATTSGTIRFHSYDSGGNWIEQITSSAINADENATVTFTTPSTISILRWSFYSDIDNAQLELGSTATSYEPYVGGIASPNPDYPQPINVVTGTQTITITDGDSQTETYTVDLGSIELCKIGDYQDYIYKSGDDWYIHKETDNLTLTGSEANLSYSNGVIYLDGTVNLLSVGAFCQYYLYGGAATNTTSAYNKGNYKISLYNNGKRIYIRNDDLTSLNDWQTWLSTHNTTIYYALATPTDTQITNITLIDQLDAVYDWAIRYGYNFTVSGNLPLIISQTLIS